MVTKDDMLIFKMRAKKPPEQPPAQTPTPPTPVPTPTPIPAPVVQKQVVRPVVQAPIIQKPIPPPPPAPMQAVQQAPKKAKQEVKPAPDFHPQYIPPVQEPNVVHAEEEKTERRKKGMYKEELRRAAIGQFCEWHPWRPAYSVCYKCHRPYCYEDISEFNGKYYCLEDIDAATVTERPQVVYGYNKLSMVAATAFSISLLFFIYFQYGFLVYALTTVITTGVYPFILNNFLYSLNLSYAALFGGLIMSIVQFIGGLLIFAQARRGYWFGIIGGSVAFVIFSYAYVINSEFYGFIMCAIAVTGIVTLGYSRREEVKEEQKEASMLEAAQANWSNPKSF